MTKVWCHKIKYIFFFLNFNILIYYFAQTKANKQHIIRFKTIVNFIINLSQFRKFIICYIKLTVPVFSFSNNVENAKILCEFKNITRMISLFKFISLWVAWFWCFFDMSVLTL